MELMTLKLLFVGGVLATAALIVIISLVIQRLAEWLKSGRKPVRKEPLSVRLTAKRRPQREGRGVAARR